MERMMIASLQLNSTTTGKQIVDLFSNDTRLQYPVLRLFDLSELINIGIDPNELQPGQTVHRRFWAYYVESKKTNGHGRPYKDVQYLELCSSERGEELPSNSAGTLEPEAVAALLDELRRIRIHLEAILRHLSDAGTPKKPKTTAEAAAAQSIHLCPTCSTRPCICDDLPNPAPPGDVAAVREPPIPSADDPTLRYAGGSEVSDNDDEIRAYTVYLTAEKKPPPDVDALRQWILDTAKPRP